MSNTIGLHSLGVADLGVASLGCTNLGGSTASAPKGIAANVLASMDLSLREALISWHYPLVQLADAGMTVEKFNTLLSDNYPRYKDGLRDLSGNGHHLTIYNMDGEDGGCMTDEGLYFDGEDDRAYAYGFPTELTSICVLADSILYSTSSYCELSGSSSSQKGWILNYSYGGKRVTSFGATRTNITQHNTIVKTIQKEATIWDIWRKGWWFVLLALLIGLTLGVWFVHK